MTTLIIRFFFKWLWKKIKAGCDYLCAGFTDLLSEFVLSGRTLLTFYGCLVIAILLCGNSATAVSLFSVGVCLWLSLLIGAGLKTIYEIMSLTKKLNEPLLEAKNLTEVDSYEVCYSSDSISVVAEEFPVKPISITVEPQENAILWKFEEKDSAISGICTSVLDPDLVYAVEEEKTSDFLEKEKQELEEIEEGLSGIIAGGGKPVEEKG